MCVVSAHVCGYAEQCLEAKRGLVTPHYTALRQGSESGARLVASGLSGPPVSSPHSAVVTGTCVVSALHRCWEFEISPVLSQ